MSKTALERKLKDIEKRIASIEEEIKLHSAFMSAINQLLVEKGIFTNDEFLKYCKTWLETDKSPNSGGT